MNKQSVLEQIKQEAFEDELEKVGMSPKTYASSARKMAVVNNFLANEWRKLANPGSINNSVRNLKIERNIINSAIKASKPLTKKSPIRNEARRQFQIKNFLKKQISAVSK